MDLRKYYVKEGGTTETFYIPESKDWYVTVKALTERERKERNQLMLRETVKRPQTKAALAKVKDMEFIDSAVEYLMVQVRDFEYNRCVVDFCLPFVPKDKEEPVNFYREGKTLEQIKKLLDNLPKPLEEFIEDCISKVNKEGKYEEEAEEAKNASVPLSATN